MSTNDSTPDPNIVQRIVNAWDCCGTCAGGVLASYVADRVADAEAKARADERAKVLARVDDYAEEEHSDECGMGACVRCVVDEFAHIARGDA